MIHFLEPLFDTFFPEPSDEKLQSLISILQNPSGGLQRIRKGVDILKENNKIELLEDKSRLYAEGGENFETALESAFQQVLVLYRDALIKSTSTNVEQLQQELFIDLKAGACHKTNRLTFLILSLQSFVLAARTGKLSQFDRSDVQSIVRDKIRDLDSIPIEEASWKWLKDYPSWASAM